MLNIAQYNSQNIQHLLLGGSSPGGSWPGSTGPLPGVAAPGGGTNPPTPPAGAGVPEATIQMV